MLRYVGKGFIPGIPARDLTNEEVKELGEVIGQSGEKIPAEKALIQTGLYKKVEKTKKLKQESE